MGKDGERMGKKSSIETLYWGTSLFLREEMEKMISKSYLSIPKLLSELYQLASHQNL